MLSGGAGRKAASLSTKILYEAKASRHKTTKPCDLTVKVIDAEPAKIVDAL